VPEIIRLFSLDRVSPSGAIFDVNKLKWMNGMYIRQMTPEDILKRSRPFLEQIEGYPGSYSPGEIEEIVRLLRERIELITEISDAAEYFFKDPVSYDPKGLVKAGKTAGLETILEALADRLDALDDFSHNQVETAIRSVAEDNDIGAGKVIHPTRLALSGRTGGPGLFELMTVLGRERCVSRLRQFIRRHPWSEPVPG
jgi:glutamyl/glutaminyl-tRNA synthetase